MKKIISIAICILATTANNMPVNEKENYEISAPIKPEIASEIIIEKTESTTEPETNEKENSVQEKVFCAKN